MQLQKLLLVFGLALLGISLSEAIPGGRGGGQDDEEKAIEKRARTSMNIQRLKNDLKLLLECQALNKEDRSLTDGPCVSFIFGMEIQLQTNILSTFFFNKLHENFVEFCKLKKVIIVFKIYFFFHRLKQKNERFCQLKMSMN